VPSNEQRREAAKRKLERQLERRVARAKRNRVVAVSSTVVVTLLVIGGIYWLSTREPSKDQAAKPDDPTATTTTPMPQGKKTGGGCAFEETPTRKAAKDVGLPDDPKDTPKDGTVSVKLRTNQGEIPLTLDRAKAPCAAQSFLHLTKAKFFDGTECHRMTTTEALKVLQCGDPTATGSGGPGYQFKDETPRGNGKAPIPEYAYKRGVLAMANSGPGTNGSQFFVVYADSQLPPKYTIFGTIGEPGLTVLDKVAAGGVEPGKGGDQDGKPKLGIRIETATAA
jgi:peptidyl-prolyl cis-trans isomerase B (cyclophilin B)